MHFSTIVQLIAVVGLVNSAPLDPKNLPADLQQLEAEIINAVGGLQNLGVQYRKSTSRLQPPKTTPSPPKPTTTPAGPNKAITVASRPPVTTIKTTTTTKSTTTPSTTKSTTKSTTTSTTTSANSVWTSVNIANCPTSVPIPNGPPDFNAIPSSCGQSWLDIANMWRKAYGLPSFSWSAHCAEVAYGAAYNASGGAKQFVHSNLGYWGTSAEVESPGYIVPYQGIAPLYGVTPFSAAIINWLCEVPSDQQLKPSGYSGIDLCPKIQSAADYIGETPGETGHHDIMLGPYTKIGCAFVYNTQNPTGPFAGIYVCDFQY